MNKLFVEAVMRLDQMPILDEVKKAFANEKRVMVSEHVGLLYNITDDMKKAIQAFESKNGGIVYHVILNDSDYGRMWTFLYVSNHEEEWQFERELLKVGLPIAYVVNLDNESFSQLGTVEIKYSVGGIQRIGV